MKKVVEAKRIEGEKVVRGKKYRYVYYTLPLNLYVPKSVIERFGTTFELIRDEEKGTWIIRPKKD